jgi:hypothetical protein
MMDGLVACDRHVPIRVSQVILLWFGVPPD